MTRVSMASEGTESDGITPPDPDAGRLAEDTSPVPVLPVREPPSSYA